MRQIIHLHTVNEQRMGILLRGKKDIVDNRDQGPYNVEENEISIATLPALPMEWIQLWNNFLQMAVS